MGRSAGLLESAQEEIMEKSDPPAMKVVKTSDMPWADALKRGNYENQRKDLGGLRLMRSGLWQLAPGKKSFPLHRHQATEEALFVISGRGKVRTESGDTAIGPGDYVAFPPGGPAHQLVNDGQEPLVYLGLSANAGSADVVEYPDSGKVACAVGAPGAGKRFVFSADGQVDYFANDKDA
jgi:uncharacterized cupin superfamily protein